MAYDQPKSPRLEEEAAGAHSGASLPVKVKTERVDDDPEQQPSFDNLQDFF